MAIHFVSVQWSKKLHHPGRGELVPIVSSRSQSAKNWLLCLHDATDGCSCSCWRLGTASSAALSLSAMSAPNQDPRSTFVHFKGCAKGWVAQKSLYTASGTRSVIEVLFISFQRFLLQTFPCLAAQQLQYSQPACGTLRQTFNLTLRLTQLSFA